MMILSTVFCGVWLSDLHIKEKWGAAHFPEKPLSPPPPLRPDSSMEMMGMQDYVFHKFRSIFAFPSSRRVRLPGVIVPDHPGKTRLPVLLRRPGSQSVHTGGVRPGYPGPR
jgi:hypothetical protein